MTKFTAIAYNGEILTRTSKNRIYTHCIVYMRGGAALPFSQAWASSASNAEKVAATMRNKINTAGKKPGCLISGCTVAIIPAQ